MNIKYLVGNKKISNQPSEPFGTDELKFLEDFSKILKSDKSTKNKSDILSFSFWCRKKNLVKLSSDTINKNLKVGIGLIFHITPSNVPTNFLFSLILGLITGNSNIIKVPQREFDEINIICNCLNKALRKNKKIQNRIAVVKYDDDFFTRKFSSICDGRMIWGGDNTIQNLRKIETKPRNRDINFADRYSFAIINAEQILKLNRNKLLNLTNNFFNDTYKFDQNACTSPHLIAWYGNKNKISLAKNKFWNSLHKIVKNKYKITNFVANDKLNELYKLSIENDKLGKLTSHENMIYRFQFDKVPLNNDKIRGKWGIFFETEIKSFSKLNNFINEKYQTLTYFGFSKKVLENLLLKYKFRGIDRIVPVGSSMNLSLIWDGYDLKNILTRNIEIL
ncbi:hypothetical protein N9U81_05665 [Candidatus Pelagibacter sp.]|nr:hypothetical protein [Candidatus Pelagibacter sp.]